ncbi:AraC family transcriptional regulator [Hymenobacter sp. ASUV-10]|uniref:AraC family transcriptional regulator n=2 Tax=Hymenobacter aranciens TaxID=3063996 RepID=A0ABT9BAI3_9BACT|nr:AraC family transcriptional regulator [Hymenobacter sp. ASUV-10]
MKLYIKNMVSNSCKGIVLGHLNTLGLRSEQVELGQATLLEPLTSEQHHQLQLALLSAGLELVDAKKARLVEKIKAAVVMLVLEAELVPKMTHSEYLSGLLEHNYATLAALFAEVTGSTIEQYIIEYRIECAQKLLLYNELNVTQISYKLNFSSVAHLSNQFKKVTGLTPSAFRKTRLPQRSKRSTGNSVITFCNYVRFVGARRVTFEE